MRDLYEEHRMRVAQIIDSGYIIIPRAIAEGMYSEDRSVRNVSHLLHVLLVLSAHTGRMMEYKGHRVFCKKGELFISARKLAGIMKLPSRTVDRLLIKLKQKGFIETEFIKVGQLIRLIHYGELTSPLKKRKKSASESVPQQNRIPCHILEERRRWLRESEEE